MTDKTKESRDFEASGALSGAGGHLLTDPSSRGVFKQIRAKGEDGEELLVAQEVGKPIAPRFPQENAIPPEFEGQYYEESALRARDLGDFQLAEIKLKTLLSKQSSRGRNSPEVADTLVNLGLVCEGSGKFLEAEGYYKSALTVNQNLHKQDKEHPSLNACQENINRVHPFTAARTKDDLAKAQKTYEVPRELEKAYDAKAMELARSGKYTEAQEAFTTLLKTQEKRYGTKGVDSAPVAGTLLHLGLIYELDEKFDEAKQQYKRGLEVGRVAFKNRDTDIVPGLLVGLAGINFREGKPDEAAAGFEEALKAYEKGDVLRFGEKTAKSIAQTHRLYAAVLHSLVEINPALKAAEAKELERAKRIDALITEAAERRKKKLEELLKGLKEQEKPKVEGLG